jgi:hypothetical protein
MSNLAEKFEFAPRVGLQRSLKYRPHIKWTYYLCLVMAGLILLTSLSVSVPHILESSLLESAVTILVCSFVPLLLFLEARFLVKPLAFSTVDVLSDRLEINRINEKIQIPYAEIDKISFSYLPYTGGWFKLETARKSYRFTVVLERSEYILESIASFNSKLVSIEKLESYRRTAIVSDYTWAHFYKKFKPQRYWLNKYFLTPSMSALVISSILGFKYHSFSLKKFLLLALVTAALQIILSSLAWWITSIILTFQTRSNLKKNPNNLPRDFKFENRIEAISQLIQKAILIMAVVITSFLVLLK